MATRRGRSRRMRRVRRHRSHRHRSHSVTRRRKHHVTHRRSMKGGDKWEDNRDKATKALVGTEHKYRNAQAAVDYGEQLLGKATVHEDYEVATAYMAFGARYQAALLELSDAANKVLTYPETAVESPGYKAAKHALTIAETKLLFIEEEERETIRALTKKRDDRKLGDAKE